MTDEQNQIDLDDEGLEATNENFVALRNAHKATKKELKELRGKYESIEPSYRNLLIEKTGFGPDSPQAKALLKLHEGDLTVDALAETAKSYGLTPAEGAAGEQKPELSAEQQAAIASSQTDQQLAAVSTPVEPQTLQTRIAEAEANGDMQEAVALKQELLHQAS